MSHKTRVERHIVVDLTSAVAAASLVVALTEHSWVAALLTLASGTALFLMERNNIQEEDQLEAEPEFEVVETVAVNSLSEANLQVLLAWAKYPPSNNIPPEGRLAYHDGLRDGAAIASDWVLKQIKDSE